VSPGRVTRDERTLTLIHIDRSSELRSGRKCVMAEELEVSRPDVWMPRRLFDWLHWPERWPMVEEMRVEEYVDGDELVVRCEMAGIDPDKDVDIQVTDGSPNISAERREKSESKDKGGYRSEFRYGSSSRRVPLPAGASEKDVKATYTDGILEVRLPIDRGAAEARKVKVQRA
jgi:HSP20 family protein